MTTFLVIIHVLICLSLIVMVLLQSGKGSNIGAAFGGSSQTMFGSAGATTFLSKATTVVAVVFMLTSLGLAFLSGSRRGPAPTKPTTKQSAPAKTPAKTPVKPAPSK